MRRTRKVPNRKRTTEAAHLLPGMKGIIDDRMRQALAKMSLVQIDDQFPVTTRLLTRAPDTVMGTVKSEAEKRIDRMILDLTTERFYPQSLPNRAYSKPDGSAPWNPLRAEPLSSGLDTHEFQVNQQISSDTTQGTVYSVDIHPDPTLHYTEIAERQFDLSDGIAAVLKKSPIYPIRWWFRYTVVNDLLSALLDTGGDKQVFTGRTPSAEALRRAFDAADIEFKDPSAITVPFLTTYADRLWERLVASFEDLDNDAYADAIGYYLGSRLVERGLSPFFPLLYGTSRAYDTAYFGPEEVDVYGPWINDQFPVQTTFIQPLTDTVFTLYDEGFFRAGRRNSKSVDGGKLYSLFAQVIFGLDQAQESFGLVHNDLHWGNLMYEPFPDDYALYYRHIPTGQVYRVPTFGKVYKMIDFGRATFRVGQFNFGSRRADQVWGGKGVHNLRGRNNDLYQFAFNAFLYLSKGTSPVIQGSVPVPTEEFYDMLSSIIGCGPDHQNTVTLAKTRCKKRMSPEMREQIGRVTSEVTPKTCRKYMRGLYPYAVDSDCDGAVPKDNIDWFWHFMVPESAVPEGTMVYPIY